MENLELLWQYQQEDMKADRIDREIRRSATRQAAEKARTQYMDLQKQYKQIEEQVAVLSDRKDAIRDAIVRCQEQLKTLTDRFEANPPADLDATQAMIAEASRFHDTISSYEQEMRRISKDATEYDRRQRSIRHEAATVKETFSQAKAAYEKETAEKKVALEAQRAVVKEKAATVPAELMEKYNTIKRHITPPMARLVGDQCSGCNTAQPSALLSKIKSGSVIIECETCGRMIIP